MSIQSRRFGVVALYSFAFVSALLALIWAGSSAIALNQGENPHLLTARAGHTATALSDGSIVIAGGSSQKGYASGIEVYDVATTKSWAGPRMITPRAGHTATLLADGSVLLVGGRNATGALDSTELYNPATGAVSKGATLNQARTGHTATPLADGRILIAGGNESGVAELFDPKANAFYTVDKLTVARSGHSAIRLATGQVLLVGGYGEAAATAEVFDPASMRFSAIAGGLKAARVQPTLNLLPDGKVQVYGGDSETTMEVFSTQGYFSSRGHLLRDSSAFWSVLHSPASAALVSMPASNKSAAREVLGDSASAFERTGHSATRSSAKMIVAGGRDRAGGALDLINSFESCGATVTTDLTDYHPGQTVIMSGAGWMPGEAITLNLHRDTNDPPDTVLYATADENGDWTNAEYLVQQYDLNVTFVLTATGDSGCSAQTTFTDAGTPPQVNFLASGLPNGASVTVTYRRDPNGSGTEPLDSSGCPVATPSTTGSSTFIVPATGSRNGNDEFSKFCYTYPATVTFASVTYSLSSSSPSSPLTLPANGSPDVNVTGFYVSACTPPTISVGPGNSNITFGSDATFNVTLTGSGTITTQWQVSIGGGAFTDIGSPDTSASLTRSFTLTAPPVSSSGNQYRLRVVNPCGGADIFSNAATLTEIKFTPTVVATGGTFPYDGNPHTGSCTVTGVLGGDLGPLAATHTPTDPPLAAGDYVVHCDYAASANYNAASDTETLKITKVNATVTATGGTFPYDGNPHTGSCSVTGVGGAILPAPTATHTPTDPPVNAGPYVVTCNYAGDTNYNPGTDTDPLEITKVNATVTATGGTFPYDTNPHTGSCSVTGVGGVVLPAPTATHTPTDPPVNAGLYTVTCNYAGDTNYNPGTDTDPLEITKVNATVTATGGTFPYDADPHTGSCSVTGVGGVVLPAPTATHTPTDPPVSAGLYTVTCTYAGDTNYNPGSDTEGLEITKVNATVTAIGGTFPYDTNPHAGSCSVTGVGGVVLPAPTATHTPTDPPVNAGLYTVTCNYAGDTNYNPGTDTEGLEITKVNATVTATGGTFPYDANPHTGTCSVTGVGGAVLPAPTATHTPTDPPVNAGSYTVTCNYAGDTNYNPGTDTDSLEITKIDATVTATGGTFPYDANPHTGTCSVTGVGGAVLPAPTATHTPSDPPVSAGLYTVTCNYAGDTNYNPGTDTDGLEITKVNATVTATGGTFPYDTFPHTGSCSVTGVGGVVLPAPTATHTPTDPPVNAGLYTVTCNYAGDTNYNPGTDTEALEITRVNATVTATGGTFPYDTFPHTGSCSVTGVGGVVLAAPTATHTPTDPPVNAGSYTVTCNYAGNTNYNPGTDSKPLTINKANATIVVTGYNVTYDTNPHTATGSATGIGGLVLTSGLDLSGTTHTNAGNYTDTWVFTSPDSNYNSTSGTVYDKIGKATPSVTATGGSFTFDNTQHPGSCTVTGVGTDGSLGALAPTYTPAPTPPATAPVTAGTYTVNCNYPGSANYLPGSATATILIGTRAALVNYIGQQVFVTSGSSATTAQVTLSASVQDPTGLALAGATMTFIDITNGSPGKVLAANVPVAPVQNQPDATGTANKIVTLSTGQYGAESYLIRVVMTGNYDNTAQPTDDKTATVVVAKPADTNETMGGGEFAGLASSAGVYKGAVGEAGSYTIALKYNKSGANLQGKITVSVKQPDGSIIYVKSNSISSMAVVKGNPKTSTIYTKASLSRVMPDTSVVTLDGNVTLRIDAEDGATDKVGVTVLSSKDSTLYYSNQWLLQSNVWKTVNEAVNAGGFVTIN